MFGIDEGYPKTIDGWIGLIHPKDRADTQEYLRTHVIAQRNRFERAYRILRPDNGQERWVFGLGELELDAEGRTARMIGTIQDITERKLAELALRESEARLSSVFRAVAVGIGIVVDRVIQEVNEAACEMVAYSREELIGQPSRMVYPTDEDYLAAGRGYPLLSTQSVATAETRWRKKDGTVINVIINIAPIEPRHPERGVTFVALDVTEHKRAEQALRASEAFLDTILEQSPHSMWVSDDRGTLVRMNQASRDLLHARDEELVGKYNVLQDNVVAEQGALPLVKRVFEQGDRVRFTLRYDTSQLRSVPLETPARVILEVTVSPVLDDRKRVTHAIIQHVDITERVQAEDALRASLEEKVVLLKEIHHRVKNNLQVVSSLLNLQAGKVQNPEVQSLLRDTQGRVRAMAVLHQTLYASDNLARVNVRDFAQTICSQVASAFLSDSRDIRVQLDIAAITLPLDQAIPAGLILNELLSNAFKHAFVDRVRGEITVQLRIADEGHAVLQVTDDGIGLPGGAGVAATGSIGLLLVDSLVRQLEGELVISHEAGTTFRIVFPTDAPSGWLS